MAVDQLGHHLHLPVGAVPGPAHLADQQIVDAELARDLHRRLGGVAILVRAGRCDHRELTHLGEFATHLVDDAVGKIGIIGSPLIHERQDRETLEGPTPDTRRRHREHGGGHGPDRQRGHATEGGIAPAQQTIEPLRRLMISSPRLGA